MWSRNSFVNEKKRELVFRCLYSNVILWIWRSIGQHCASFRGPRVVMKKSQRKEDVDTEVFVDIKDASRSHVSHHYHHQNNTPLHYKSSTSLYSLPFFTPNHSRYHNFKSYDTLFDIRFLYSAGRLSSLQALILSTCVSLAHQRHSPPSSFSPKHHCPLLGLSTAEMPWA